jgi:hypothetical protein
LRLPRVQVGQRRLPLAQQLERRQLRGQAPLGKRGNDGPRRHVGIRQQAANRGFADRRIAVAKLSQQLADRFGRRFPRFRQFGGRHRRSALEILLQPGDEIRRRHRPFLFGHDFPRRR